MTYATNTASALHFIGAGRACGTGATAILDGRATRRPGGAGATRSFRAGRRLRGDGSRALYALAAARGLDIVCLVHITNTMATAGDDFEKGDANGARASLALAVHVAHLLAAGTAP